jgi:broad specificity phosphatase PhoE
VHRLVLVTAAPTAAARAGRFPAADEPIDAAAAEGIGNATRWRADSFVVAPERRARQTLVAVGIDPDLAETDPALADLDMGRWTGRALADVAEDETDEAIRWRRDPAASPPGGEGLVELTGRVRGWLDAVAPADARTLVAVTHPAVVRAAIVVVLDAPQPAFWSIDALALTATTLTHDGRRWALRIHGMPLGTR